MTGNLGKGNFMRVIFLQKGKKDLKSVVFGAWNIFDIFGKILPKKIPQKKYASCQHKFISLSLCRKSISHLR